MNKNLGWEVKTLGEVCEINPKNKLDDDLDVSFIPMNLIADKYQNKFSYEIRKWSEVKKGYTHLQNRCIAIAKITPCFENGKCVILQDLKNGYGAGTTELIVVLADENKILPKFIFYFFNTTNFTKEGVKNFKGTAGQLRISKDFITNLQIPLPPLEIQKAIVEKLENAFTHIDEAVRHLKAVQTDIPRLKSSLLHCAFSGKLTESPLCHSEGEARRISKDSTLRDISGFALNMTNGGVCHSKPLADEESKPSCHTEPLGEVSYKSNKDISLVSQAQYDTIALTQNQIAFSKYPAFIYMVSNKNNTTLYIGVTSNLQKCIYEHKNHLYKGFSDKYNCEKLVYFESFDNINQAIEREKYLKGKKRAFKENLINAINPKWLDLYNYLFCHSEALAEESHIVDSNKDISLTLNMINGGICHSKPLADEESKPSCHTEPLGEVSYKSNKDISHFSNAQYDKPTCHSEALAEESQEIFRYAQNDKGIKFQNDKGDNLPQGWEIKTLGEIGKVVSGGTPSTSNKDNFDGEIAWITPADLSGYKEKYISKGKRNLSEQGLKNSSARLLPPNSILFSSRAPIGYVAIASNTLCTNQGFKNLIPHSNVSSEYIYYFLLHSKRLAESVASGTTFKEISATNFSKLPIPLPPLATQNQIVQILESKFAHLEKLAQFVNASLENLQRLKSSLLNQAFKGELVC